MISSAKIQECRSFTDAKVTVWDLFKNVLKYTDYCQEMIQMRNRALVIQLLKGN